MQQALEVADPSLWSKTLVQMKLMALVVSFLGRAQTCQLYGGAVPSSGESACSAMDFLALPMSRSVDTQRNELMGRVSSLPITGKG